MTALSPLLAADSDFAFYLIAGLVVGLVGLVFLIVLAQYFSLWVQCKMTGAGIGLIDLIMMSFRKVDSGMIVRGKIMAVQSGLTELYPDITTRALEAHFLAKGNVPRVIQALIAAHRATIPLNWQTAAAIDLAGRDILNAVQTSVYPKVIDCPDSRNS
ncbi:MAG: flotillin-like FloA family protein, partial [Planctomycetota bacterium]|nr:flotillin-like FloA family protein [Planctomycetota bacterium]